MKGKALNRYWFYFNPWIKLINFLILSNAEHCWILSLRLILYLWQQKRIFMVSLDVFVLPAAACYLTAWWNMNAWFLMEMLNSSFDYHKVKGRLQESNLTKAKARYVGAFSVVDYCAIKLLTFMPVIFFSYGHCWKHEQYRTIAVIGTAHLQVLLC